MDDVAFLEAECVYQSVPDDLVLPNPSRFLEHDHKNALFIEVNPRSSRTGIFKVDLQRCINALTCGKIVLAADPFEKVSSYTSKLPVGAAQRINQFQTVIAAFNLDTSVLYSTWGLARFLEAQGARLEPERSRDTVQRWFFTWLRAGKKVPAIVKSLAEKKQPKNQIQGNRRGAGGGAHPDNLKGPSYLFTAMMEKAYRTYIVKGRLTVEESYGRLVGDVVPSHLVDRIFTDPAAYNDAAAPKFPSEWQWAEAVRSFRKRDAPPPAEPGIGSRGGTARKYAFGPGFFEIDSTGFQIQLVSRQNGRNLVSKPWVYLVTDVFSGLIVGYHVSLENPSWASLSMCLHNCFSEKSETFKRLGLPYTDGQWSCCHLPSWLRADKFELITNNGHRFPQSMINVEITPSFTPQGKGTIEGANAQLKSKNTKDRYRLVGLYNKFRQRGETDGKREAGISLEAFEKIIVLIIQDLNKRPLVASRIPDDADPSEIKSRLDFWNWGLKHRSGATARPSENFTYEYLLAREENAKITPFGIRFRDQMYLCDKLREFGYVQSAPPGGASFVISYHANFAGEVFFKGPDGKWYPAANTDASVIKRGLSFRELAEQRNDIEVGRRQGIVDWANQRASNAELAKSIVKEEVKKTKEMAAVGGGSRVNITENRQAEKRLARSQGFSGTINSHGSLDRNHGEPSSGNQAVEPGTRGVPPARRAVTGFDEDDEDDGKTKVPGLR